MSVGNRWRVVAASAQGTSHQYHGTPCQDAYGTRELSTGELLVAVADGAGSAAQGGVGARLAVDHALVTLEAQLAKYRPTSRKAWRQVVTEAFTVARQAINTYADEQNRSIRDYAATLLIGLLTDEGSTFGLIGDCTVVVRVADGTFCSLCPPQKGEYANATNFLIQNNALDLLNIQLWSESVQQIAFFSDGLAPLAMNLAHNRPHPPFFDPLFAFVEAAADPEVATERLTGFLASERVNARTDDDKTLVLVQRTGETDARSQVHIRDQDQDIPDPVR